MARGTEMENERLKIWLGFTKFILGTVVLGFFSMTINAKIQDRQIKINEEIRKSEIQLKDSAQESENLSKYISIALDKDLTKRRDFAKYFESVSKLDETKSRWTSYVKFIEKEISNNIKNLKSLQGKVKDRRKTLRELETEHKKYIRNEMKLSKEIETLKHKLKYLKPDIPEDSRPKSKSSDEVDKYKYKLSNLEKQLNESIQSKEKRDIEIKIQDIKVELSLYEEKSRELQSELSARSVPATPYEENTWSDWKTIK